MFWTAGVEVYCLVATLAVDLAILANMFKSLYKKSTVRKTKAQLCHLNLVQS